MISQTSGHGDFRQPHEVPAAPAAPLSRGDQFGAGAIADGVGEVLKGAREQLMLGASQLKLAAGGGIASPHDPIDAGQYTEAEFRAAVDAAENWGTYVAVHAYTPRAIRTAVRAGVRCIEHGQLLDEETARILADRGVWLSLQPFLDDADAPRFPEGSPNRAKQLQMTRGTDAAYDLAKRHDLKTAWGTDVLFDARLAARQGAMLAKMARWYSPPEALRMATGTNAELLALSGCSCGVPSAPTSSSMIRHRIVSPAHNPGPGHSPPASGRSLVACLPGEEVAGEGNRLRPGRAAGGQVDLRGAPQGLGAAAVRPVHILQRAADAREQLVEQLQRESGVAGADQRLHLVQQVEHAPRPAAGLAVPDEAAAGGGAQRARPQGDEGEQAQQGRRRAGDGRVRPLPALRNCQPPSFPSRPGRGKLRPGAGPGAEASPGRDREEVRMFTHVMIGSNDIARSKTFYDALFAAMGGKPGTQDPRGRLVYAHNGGRFMVTAPIDGQPATHANGGTIGFAMASPDQVRAWHKAGTENGGTAIEDPPGERQGAAGTLYLAYLRDPDGNKLCGLHRMG